MSATFVIVPEAPRNPQAAGAVLKFFDYAYAHGGDTATSLNYVTLPTSVQDEVRQAWTANIKGPNGAKLPF